MPCGGQGTAHISIMPWSRSFFCSIGFCPAWSFIALS
jgi:hypothetical protein